MRAPWYLGVLLIACGSDPRHVTPGQVLLYVDTDAPIPAGPGQPRSLSTPLFDRLKVEIYAPNETTPCPTCTNEFEVNALMFTQKSVSVGIAPPLHTPGYRVRVRLFKTDFVAHAGDPNADSTIDLTVALPVVDGDAIVPASVFLPTEDIAKPIGTLVAPVAASPSAPDKSKVGSWAGAERVDCKGKAPATSVCVPGGAYWMGNPNAPGFNPGSYVFEPRLVVVSPFFMSATEVTVRELRATGKTPAEVWSGAQDGLDSRDWCTFTRDPGPSEALPVNCVTVPDARAYCHSLGGDLPTEAQFEYVDSGLSGDAFPWGRDEPSCGDATFGRAGWGIFLGIDSPCKPSSPIGGPKTPGVGERDRLDLPTGTIFDLAGNLSEWTRDTWNRIDEPCWDRAKVHRDPLCTTPSPADGDLAVRRGGDWAEVATYMVASARYSAPATFDNIQTGFRCVWPATE